MKLNGTHQLLIYADDVNMLRGSVHTIEKNTEALVAVSKEIGLEVNADIAKCMVMSRDQNAGRSHTTKIDNRSFERVEQLKYSATTLMNKIPFRKKLRAHLSQGMLDTVRCRTFCLPVCFQKYKD